MLFDISTMEFEKERLRRVSEQIALQLKSCSGYAERSKSNTIAFQKSMWDHVNPTPAGDMDDLANIWQFQTELVREGSKVIFLSGQVGRLERMLKNPYFARIDFREEGSGTIDKIYIGISSLKDEKTSEILIYDWRSPVSGMFYDYELGRAAYLCPAGVIEGEMYLKRQYRIWNNEIQFMFDSSVAINDEILQEILAKSADSRMKTIVTSIQREQNSVIRDDAHRLMVVTGPAGCGKTSVALHRAAYLLFRYKDSIFSDNIAIFSPNDIFSDYISEVLPELGEENINRTTFFEYATKILGNEIKLEDQTRQMEYLLSCTENENGDNPHSIARANGIRYKSSFQIIEDVFRYVQLVEENRIFDDLYFREELIETEEEISLYFREELKFLPVIKRLEKIRNRLTEKLDKLMRIRIEEVVVETANSGEYPNPAEIRGRSIFAVRREAERAKAQIAMMCGLDLLKCYQEFVGTMTISGGNNIINYEDIPPLLLLSGLLSGFPDMSRIRHVIIDEIQDYTPVQLEIFKRLFKNSSMTMLGDPNQSICPYYSLFDREMALKIFGMDGAISIHLGKSYRSTRQITEFCNALKGIGGNVGYMDREGELPVMTCMEDRDEMLNRVIKDIGALQAGGMNSIAVIVRSEKECIQVHQILAQHMGIDMITGDRKEFFSGTVVIPSYLSKGLEFDAVLVLCTDTVSYGNPDETGLVYTICTRALHRLHIYCSGGFPEFARNIDKTYYKLLI